MDIKAIITEAATRYGVDPETALKIAHIESKLDPKAQNPRSSAGGLFQFIDDTWGRYGKGASKYDPYANADAGMRFTRDNIGILKKSLGRDPTPGEIYLAHQQGAGGALNLLTRAGDRAVDIVGGKQVRLNGGDENMTGQDFANLWAAKMGGTTIPSTPLVQGMAPPASMGAMADSEYSTNDAGQVSFADVVPTLGTTDAERHAAQAEADANKPSLWEGTKIAIGNEWSILTPFRTLGNFEPDMDFRLNEDNLGELAKGIPDEYLGEFSDAVSESHALAIRERLMRQMEGNQKLANMGALGVGLSMGAAITDPGAIAATIAIGAATGGTGIVPAVAARLGRVGLVGLGAAEGVAGNLATDIPLISVDGTRDASQLKWSVGAGLLMGGAFGALRSNPAFVQEANHLAKLGKQMQTEAVAREVNDVVQRGGNLSATRVAPEASYRTDTDELNAIYSDMARETKALFGRVRFDVTGSLLKSKNPAVQTLARYLGEDAVRAGDGQVTQIAASEVQSRSYRVSTTNWVKGFGSSWDAFRKANKIGFWKAPEELNKFKRQVSDYIRETDPSRKSQFPQHVQEAGAVFNKEMKGWWEKARDAGITRSEFGAGNYFPRYPDLNKTSALIDRFGYTRDGRNADLAGLFRDAIKAKQVGIDDALAHRMGYAMVDRFTKLHAGRDLMDHRLGSNDMDDIADILGEFIDPSDIDAVKAWATRNTPKHEKGAGDSSNLKHRVILDENFTARLPNRHTGQLEEVSIKDFYISDPNMAFHLYARNMSGNVAMAGIKISDPKTGEMLVDGIKNSADWTRLKDQMKGVGQKNGADWKADEKNLDFIYAAITGTPYRGMDEASDGATALRMLRDFNFTRLMGQVGLAQLPEIGRTTAQVGIKTMYAAMPSFRQIIKSAREGRMGDEMGDELAALGAFGADWSRTRFHIDADEFGTPVTMGGTSRVQRMNNAVAPKLHAANRFVNLYSGMAPINSLFQQWSARATFVKFARMAIDGEKPNVQRMKALGLSDADFDDIIKSINANAKFKGGVRKGTKLEAMGMDKWDGNTRAKFEMAVYRTTRSMILENDPGQFHRWLQHPLGKTIIQFRTFAVGSWTKATLQGLNMRDTEAALGFMASAFIGSAVYAGQTHLNLIGDPRAAEKAEERLTWLKLAGAAFQRTSESSLMPMGIDMASEMITGEPIFDFRSTGLASDAIFGNPTVDLINSAREASAGAASALMGDDYSAPDFKNLTRTLPFQRMMGITQLINWLGSGLPQFEQRD